VARRLCTIFVCERNDYGEPVHRLNALVPWIAHIRDLECNALYIVSHLGPVTDRMRREVAENVWHDALVTWAKSFWATAR
jgi:hypothetical protein